LVHRGIVDALGIGHLFAGRAVVAPGHVSRLEAWLKSNKDDDTHARNGRLPAAVGGWAGMPPCRVDFSEEVAITGKRGKVR
jgi:hypothetical protein